MVLVAVVLAVLLVGALVGWALTARRLAETQDAVRVLGERLEQLQLAGTPTEQALTSVEWVARTATKAVVRTTARLRVGGMQHLVNSSLEDLMHWVNEDQSEIARYTSPDGTTTLFFSDIENSTALNERLGDRRWLSLLRRHDLVVRAAIESHGGHVVKTQGDGFMAVFGTPADGVAAAQQIQERVGAERRLDGIAVRIGLHTGAVLSRDGDYFGRNVALAARVGAEAAGGQTLVSSAVHDALRHADPPIAFESFGEHELKGLTGVHELWVVS